MQRRLSCNTIEQEKEATVAVNQDKVDKSIGRVPRDLGGAFLGQLAFIDDRLRLSKVFRWLQDEVRRNATIRELNLLSDYCLDDIGIKRSESIADAMLRRLREGAYDPR